MYPCLLLIAWLTDGDSQMCYIVMMGRQIAKMFSTFSLWGFLFLMEIRCLTAGVANDPLNGTWKLKNWWHSNDTWQTWSMGCPASWKWIGLIPEWPFSKLAPALVLRFANNRYFISPSFYRYRYLWKSRYGDVIVGQNIQSPRLLYNRKISRHENFANFGIEEVLTFPTVVSDF